MGRRALGARNAATDTIGAASSRSNGPTILNLYAVQDLRILKQHHPLPTHRRRLRLRQRHPRHPGPAVELDRNLLHREIGRIHLPRG